MQTINDVSRRKQYLDEILSQENVSRKAESFKRMEVYNRRGAPYMLAQLESEFDKESVASMRKVLSINIVKRITDKQSSLYQQAPERTFQGPNGANLSDDQVAYITESYDEAKLSTKLQRAQRVRRLQNQTILQVLPTRGQIDVRIYHPHQVDVIPMDFDPEVPFAYVVSAYDRGHSLVGGDGINQGISDRNDVENQKRKDMRFVWWSAEHNFITDGNGEIVQDDPSDIANPIGVLPFIDISDEKENEFWVRKGSSLVDFAIDFAVAISDTANVNRLQGYAQGYIIADKQPPNIRVGPERFIFLPINPDSSSRPEMGFMSPNPDLNASLDFLDRMLNYFLTAEGVDPKTVNSKGEAQSFSSGFERLLASLEQFEASQEDVDQFSWVEQEVFNLFVKWSNAFARVRNAPLKRPAVALPDGATVTAQFHKPEMVQTKSDVEESAIKLLEAGVASPVDVLMATKGLDEKAAVEHLKLVQQYRKEFSDLLPVDRVARETTVTDGEEAPTVGAVATEKVADSALNGAQVTAMVEVVAQVASGQIPRESAVAIMEKAFLIPRAEAEKLIGAAGKGFEPRSLEAVQAPEANDPLETGVAV